MSGRLVLPLLAALREKGHDVPRLLESLAIDESELRSLHGRVTIEAFMDLHAACIAATGDRAFPLHAASHLDREAFPVAFYMMGSQATLRDGYRFVRPYRAMIVDRIEFNLTEHDGFSHIDFELDGKPLAPPAFAEYLLALVLALGRLLTPSAPPPSEVIFAHRFPRHAEDSGEFFGAPVRFGGDGVRYVFPMPRFDTPIEGADPHLGQLLAESAASWVIEHPTNERLRDRVRRWLAHQKLERGEPSANDLAAALHMSERTLRRRLSLESASVRALLDEVRHERAIELLDAGKSTLDEIAYRLGFSGSNAFRRAFKRWTGESPSARSQTSGGPRSSR
jgi:AraC-like DNA-binding protein